MWACQTIRAPRRQPPASVQKPSSTAQQQSISECVCLFCELQKRAIAECRPRSAGICAQADHLRLYQDMVLYMCIGKVFMRVHALCARAFIHRAVDKQLYYKVGTTESSEISIATRRRAAAAVAAATADPPGCVRSKHRVIMVIWLDRLIGLFRNAIDSPRNSTTNAPRAPHRRPGAEMMMLS